MALKYVRSESTGIYRQGWWRATDTKSQIKLARAITRASDIEWHLRELERKARAILRKQDMPLRGSHKLPFNVPRSADGMTRDAADVLWQAFLVRDWLAEGNARCAALHALRLGRAAERMAVRPFEPHVVRGRAVQQGGREGHLYRYGPLGGREKQRAAYRQAYAEIARKNPHLKRSSIAHHTALRFKVSQKTILRHTR